MMTVTLTNDRELIKMLDSLPKAFESKIVRTMIREAVKPLVSAVKASAPVSDKAHMSKYGIIQPGNLARSIGIINMRKSRYVTLLVGPRMKGAFGKAKSGWYGFFTEFGTKFITAKEWMQPQFDKLKDTVKLKFERDAVRIFERQVARYTKQGKL